MFHNSFPQRKLYSRLALLALALLSVMLGACSGAPPAQAISGAWVDKVDGTDAFIAIASNGKEVMAYVCDSKTISQWFKGQAGQATVDLTKGAVNLSAGAARLDAKLTPDAASGTVVLGDGTSWQFQAARAAGDAGLYRSEETINNEK